MIRVEMVVAGGVGPLLVQRVPGLDPGTPRTGLLAEDLATVWALTGRLRDLGMTDLEFVAVAADEVLTTERSSR